MKAFKISTRRSRLFSAVLSMLALASLLFVSCEKEKLVEVPVVNTVTDTIEIPVVTTVDRPNEAEDLVAWYSPITGTFLVDPAYLENVLETLNAQPTPNGGYTMEGVNLLGEPRIVHFQIKLAQIPEVYNLAVANEKPLTPDFIHTFTENGTSYKVFKNAECGKLQTAFESGCENGTDGASTKRFWYEIRRCERGNGFCTEAKGIIGKSVTYHNANCQGPVKGEESFYGYACWQ